MNDKPSLARRSLLAGAVPPQMLKSATNPTGLPMEVFDGIKQFSETDFSADLEKIDVPTLIVHGGDDQIVPIDASARAAAKLVKQSTLLVYEGAPHGLPTTRKHRLNADLLAFIRA